MTAVRRWTSIICLSLTATWLPAQTTATVTQTTTATTTSTKATEPVTAETDKDLTDPNALKLSMADALHTAMERNLGISLQNYDFRMSAESLREQYGLFDWFATGTVQQSSSKTPETTQFQPTQSKGIIGDLGLSQNLPAGGSYSLGFNNGRSTNVGGGTLVNPSYNPSVTFQATQPLLRNFGIDVTQHNILVARNTLGISREAFRAALMDTAITVQQAYLDLAYARRNVEVVKESLFLARDQARITQIRIDVGASAPLDILQPRVQIATTEELLISAVALVRTTEDRLRAALNLAQTDWTRPVIPTDSVEYVPVSIDVDSSVTRAMDLRPELREVLLATQSKRVQYLFARNQVLPQLDFVLSYRANGLGGHEAIVDQNTGEVTGFNNVSYGSALNQVFSGSFPSWAVGFNIGVPLSNISARAERKRSELDVAASRVTEDQERQTIMLAVRSAARDVDTAARTIVASRTAREAAEQNVEAERRRFENGMSTNFQVLTIQQQLTAARVSELQALVGYQEALANYHRQVGDVLDVNHIAVDEPQLSPEPRVFSLLNRYNWLVNGWRPLPPEDSTK